MDLSFTNMLGLSSSIHFAHIACYWKFFLLHYTQVLCQQRFCRANHAYLTYVRLQWHVWVLYYNQPSPTWGLQVDFYYCQTVAGFLMWEALSLMRGQVCHLQLFLAFTSTMNLRFPFLLPPTTHRVTVEVFDPATTGEATAIWIPETMLCQKEITGKCATKILKKYAQTWN
jgi:hypothetical protein